MYKHGNFALVTMNTNTVTGLPIISSEQPWQINGLAMHTEDWLVREQLPQIPIPDRTLQDATNYRNYRNYLN